MKKARIRENELAAQFYWSTDNVKKIVLTAPGMPYVPDEEAFTSFLSDFGCGVLQPQYIGTYDSSGIFTPENAVETLFRFSDQISKNGTIHDLRNDNVLYVPRTIDVLVAHSFGTYVAFNSILNGLDVDIAILFSPMLEYGSNAPIAGLKANLSGHIRHISLSLPLTFRLGNLDIWNDFFMNTPHVHPKVAINTTRKIVNIICVCGKEDPGIDSEISRKYVQNLCQNYGHRVNLLEYIEVDKGTHDVATLLTDDVKDYIRNKLI